MMTVSYTEAREKLASVWDETISTREPIVISRRGKEPVALLPLEELRGLEETAYLLRSPANARRLLSALGDIKKGKNLESITMGNLKKRIGLE